MRLFSLLIALTFVLFSRSHFADTVRYDMQHSDTDKKEAVLALSWHNAFCELHRHRKECRAGMLQRFFGASHAFALHGLWVKGVYCGVPRKLRRLDRRGQWKRLPELALDAETRKVLAEVMPGYRSYLHRHEWFKHGTCSGMDAQAYFRTAATLTKQVNDSQIAARFKANVGRYLSLRAVRDAARRSFGRGAGKAVSLVCRRGMITELRLHLRRLSNDLSEALKRKRAVRSRCKGGIVDAEGFRR